MRLRRSSGGQAVSVFAVAAFAASGCSSSGGRAIDAGRVIDAPPVPMVDASLGVEVVWETLVEDVSYAEANLGKLGDEIVLMGLDLVVLGMDGTVSRRHSILDPELFVHYDDARTYGNELVLLDRDLQTARLTWFDARLQQTVQQTLPAGTVFDVWAPGAETSWFLGHHSFMAVDSLRLGELPRTGDPRTWEFAENTHPHAA